MLLAILFVPVLLFYIVFISPEYLACNGVAYEGQKGRNIWGAEVNCNCEDVAFIKAFFTVGTVINAAFIMLLIITYLIYRSRRRQLKIRSNRINSCFRVTSKLSEQ